MSFASGSKHINSTDIMVSVKLLPLAAVVFLALLSALLLLGACGGEATIPETATPPTIPAANTDTTEPRLTPGSALAPTIVPTATLMPIAPPVPTSMPPAQTVAPSIELLENHQTGEQRIRITSTTSGVFH